MFFSEKFNVSSELIETYGAVDISLICDMPLFVDPLAFPKDHNSIHYFFEKVPKNRHFLLVLKESASFKIAL